MQALHMSGQAAEFRDPPPVREPASSEINNTEHPFMRLLTRLRNAMQQGEESDQRTLDTGSRLNPEFNSKTKSLTKVAGLNGAGTEGPDGSLLGSAGLQGTEKLAARSQASKAVDEAGEKATPGSLESGLAYAKGKDVSVRAGGKAKPNSHEAPGVPPGLKPGKGSAVPGDETLTQGTFQRDQKQLSGQGSVEQESIPIRDSDHTKDALAKRRVAGTRGSLDGTTVAASGNLSGAMNLAGLTRPQPSASSREKIGQGNSVEDAGISRRRPSRYSVVDMRLKASAVKTRIDGSLDSKPEGKSGGTTTAELNRSGLPGTDAAGRQISNDQPAGGYSELTKGGGAEGSDKAPASFADNLATRLRDGGAMDIVRSAQIVLKDGDAGLIRLRLEPESLGGVKIELKMADKQISARIIVESDLAGEAFRSSLDSLRDAFASSGFETTSIEVEVRDGRAGTGDAGRGDTQNDDGEKSRAMYTARKAEEFGDAVPSADAAYGRYGVIDLVV